MKIKYFIAGIIIIIIDQLSKLYIIDRHITIIPNFFEFNYTENPGGAFGIGNFNLVLITSILIVVGIIIFLIKHHKNITNYIPFILIISGSMGNIFDRIFRGYVIDFIDVNIFNFPNFNIADICIVIGVVILVLFEIKNSNNKTI